MASDVTEEDGRLRGFDVDDNDNIDTLSFTEKFEENKCKMCQKTVAALQRTIEDQASRITKLEKQLARYVEDSDESQSKKRKRDDQTIFDAAMIADSSDTDIKVRSITEENTTLKTQLQTDAEKPIVEDTSMEANH